MKALLDWWTNDFGETVINFAIIELIPITNIQEMADAISKLYSGNFAGNYKTLQQFQIKMEKKIK